jgi:hypothetical protein
MAAVAASQAASSAERAASNASRECVDMHVIEIDRPCFLKGISIAAAA